MKLIIGKINASNTIGYWNIGNNYTPDVRSGDYAVVENKNDFDLIKVYRENGIRYYKFLITRGIKLAIKEFKNK